MIRNALAGIVAGIALGAASTASATIWKTHDGVTLSGLYVFGDSLSDAGNVALATGGAIPSAAAGYAWGRFTNGPTYVDRIASAFGMPNVPALIPTGNNYAFGGAEINSASVPPGLALQLGMYGSRTGWHADPNALYIVYGGGNDINRGSDLSASLATLYGIVHTLVNMGATNILIPNAPDLGRTPGNNTDPVQSAIMTARTLAFNAGLKHTIGLLEASHHIDILEADIFGWSSAILDNGAAYGLTDTVTACLTGTGPACGNANEHFFWDDIHPTSRIHQMVGEHLIDMIEAAAVPEPGSLALLAAGLGMLAARRRKKTA